MRKRLGRLDRVGTPWEHPWNAHRDGDLSLFSADPPDQEYVYAWHIIFPHAKELLELSTTLLDSGKTPVVPPVAAHDMAYCTEGIMAGCTSKDGNKSLLQYSMYMWSGESERADTWSEHYGFIQRKLGILMNNRHSTAIMDENPSSMRACASKLPLIELMRCSEHRGKTVSKSGSKGDKNRYRTFAAAPTLDVQTRVLAGCSERLQEQIKKVPLKEQSQASKTRPGYGETTSNIIESTWNMHYAARRANLARALLVMTRKHTDRIKSLKKEAAEWPVSAELTPRAEKKLEELRELCRGLSNIVVDNPGHWSWERHVTHRHRSNRCRCVEGRVRNVSDWRCVYSYSANRSCSRCGMPS